MSLIWSSAGLGLDWGGLSNVSPYQILATFVAGGVTLEVRAAALPVCLALECCRAEVCLTCSSGGNKIVAATPALKAPVVLRPVQLKANLQLTEPEILQRCFALCMQDVPKPMWWAIEHVIVPGFIQPVMGVQALPPEYTGQAPWTKSE